MLYEIIVVFRVCIAAVLGFIVGAERKRKKYGASGRTYSLVAIGAAGAVATLAPYFPNGEATIIGGVLTSIGFLGAGLIIKQNTEGASGLTTAASLWATAVMGVMVGSGHYFSAAALSILVFLVLSINRFWPFRYETKEPLDKGLPK